MSDPPGRRSGSLWATARSITWRSVLAVVAALALGIAGTFVAVTMFAADGGPPLPPEAGTASVEDRAATSDPDRLVDAGFEDLPPPPTEPIDAPANDPATAVEGFLAAEVRNDFEGSYEFLSSDEWAIHGSPAGWIAAHADVLPPVTGFEIDEVTEGPDGLRVGSVVGFVPSLDEVVGLVPAQAEVAWAVVRDGESYGVSLQNSSFAPVYVGDDAAAAATQAWVASRQACENAGEWGGALLGVQAAATALCGSSGAPEVGEPSPLPELDAAPFIVAFGEEALTWSRVVDVEAPVAMRVVLAPVGAHWRVIGVLPPAATGATP